MSSFVKLAIPLVATALLGLSWPPATAFAQPATAPAPAAAAPVAPAPPATAAVQVVPTIPDPLLCGRPSLLFSVTDGLVDNFSPPPDPTSPSQFLKNAPYSVAVGAPNVFDQTNPNYHFGDTLSINVPQNSTIISARLITRMKPLNEQPQNDGVSFHVPGTPAGASIGFAPQAVTGNNWNPGSPSKIFQFTPPAAFLTAMTAAVAPGGLQQALDVYVQDDTSVDFLRLEVCYIPPQKPDVAATKSHKGSVYILSVSNPGAAIPTGDQIEVTDYIPVGLTVTATNAPAPWTCVADPPAAPNVTGPAVIKCTYPVTTAIASGANLPPIQLATTGKSACPNCMRVRLLRPGASPPQESDTANNVSCVQ